MVNPAKVSRSVLMDLLSRGLSNAEMAAELGVNVRTIVRARTRENLNSRVTFVHSELVPWKLDMKHMHATPAKYLRLLSRAGQGGHVNPTMLATAEAWAEGLVGEGLDVAYHHAYEGQELCREGGFRTVPADQIDWLLKKALARAANPMR